MATELATAYISLIPELKGAGKSIASQLGGVDVAPTGRKLGKSLSDGISSGIDSSGIKQLENAVASASQKVGRAMASEKDATNQLNIAQQRLVEVRSKYADGSSQVMAAEAKVESAQRKAATASERTKSAQVELKRAQEQLSTANKKVSSSSDDASRGIASMGKTAGSIKGALSACAKIAGPAMAALGFGQLVAEAGRVTDATQKFKGTLDFAGLGKPEIEALSKSTRKYADDTVYELSDIQNITAQLASNGVSDYDKLAEAAGNLNAVAGGSAETFKSVGMVMTQTAGAGKLTTENWNQLTDAIPGASGKLQEAMLKNGAYTGNFRKAMEQGQISAEEFNQAIMQLGFDDAAVKAAKSTSTFEGAMGNLQAAAVGGISDLLARSQPAITGVVNGLVPVVEGAFNAISTAVGFVVDNIGLIAPAVAAVSAAFAGFKAATFVTSLMSSLGGLSGMISTVKTAATGLFAALAANPIAMVVAAIAALVAGFIALYNSNEQFRNAANALFAQLATIFGPALQQIGAMVTNLVTTIASMVGPTLTSITMMIMSAMPAIQNAISSALSIIGAIWNAIWPTLSIVVGYVFSMIQTVVSTVLGVIQGIIQVVTSAIQGNWSGVWEGIKAIVSSVWEGIKSTVSNGINAAKAVISSVLNGIKGVWDSCWNGIKSFFSSIWDGIKSAASTGVSNVYNTVTGIKDKIIGFFSGAGSWLLDAGRNILQGLWDGISGALGWLGDKLAGIGDFIVQHKGPPSYDAVMLVKNGELIMDGLLRGMANGWGDVEDFVKSRNTALSASYSVTARAGARPYAPGNQNAELYGLLRDIRAAMPESMTPREFRRAVAACG